LASNYRETLATFAERVSPMKKPIEIEKLLAWTFREELPKAGAARALTGIGFGRAHRAVEKFGEYLTLIDCDGINRFGVVSDLMALEEPDGDAIAVFEAVTALDEIEVELPEGWNPLADMDGIDAELPGLLARALDRVTVVDAAGARRMKVGPGAIVTRHAIMGDAPCWQAEQPERKIVVGAKGAPAWFRMITVETSDGPKRQEVDGYDQKGKRPFPGAYRKTFLDPDPLPAALARAEYEVWHSALDYLAAVLAGELQRFDVLPTARPARPWEEAGLIEPRILPNLLALAPGAASDRWWVLHKTARG
jgi:hypothetical protein